MEITRSSAMVAIPRNELVGAGETELFWDVGIITAWNLPAGCLELGDTGAFQGSGSEAFPMVQGLKVKEEEMVMAKQG